MNMDFFCRGFAPAPGACIRGAAKRARPRQHDAIVHLVTEAWLNRPPTHP